MESKVVDGSIPSAVGIMYHVQADLVSAWTEEFIREFVVQKIVIVSSNMRSLGEFEKYWSQYLEVVVIAVPDNNVLPYEFLLTILDAQNILLEEVVWISTLKPPGELHISLKAIRTY
jgi:hypothetical protein